LAKRYTRKELKRPDQFQSFWTRVYEFLKATTRPIAFGTIATIVVIVGVMLYMHFAEKQRAASSKALAYALRVLNSENAPQVEDPDARKDSSDADIPKYKTAKERREAALKLLDKLEKSYGSTGAARDALLARAGVKYDLGRYDEAIRDYKAFLSKGASGKLKAMAHEGLGYAHEAKGELDRALDEYRLIASAGEFFRDRALYDEGRILERKGDTAGAKKLYQEILDKTPTTPLRDDISNRLALLQK
jgi:predicted negative regulator of RcsB-dependent stress response